MKVAIVGYATEGIVSADYYFKLGYGVTICDQNETLVVPQDYSKQLGGGYLDNLDKFGSKNIRQPLMDLFSSRYEKH